MPRSRSSRRTPRSAARPKAADPLSRYAKAFGVTKRRMTTASYKELTKAQRASVLQVGVRRLAGTVTLSPSHPRTDGADLELFSPTMVECGEVKWSGASKPSTGYALFSSKHWSITQPTVEVSFDLIEPGQKHLVELYFTCIQKSDSYDFRVIPGPTGQYHDETFTGDKTVLTEVIDPAPGYDGRYYVIFMQKNPKSQLRAWYFHKVVITAVGS